jgi:hypothetical protein
MIAEQLGKIVVVIGGAAAIVIGLYMLIEVMR